MGKRATVTQVVHTKSRDGFIEDPFWGPTRECQRKSLPAGAGIKREREREGPPLTPAPCWHAPAQRPRRLHIYLRQSISRVVNTCALRLDWRFAISKGERSI
jgi:hypothetical protein